jgi:4-amino-4-deoxychorismate lyase
MCHLFETIKIAAGEAQNLPLHDERMNRSRRELYGSNDFLRLSDRIRVPETVRNKITRCRVVYTNDIHSIEFSPYDPADIKTLKTVDAGSVVYNHKYLDRTKITALIDKSAADDILMIRNGFVTDASFANIVFTDGERWVTPDTPLLQGTMREFLLRNGVIKMERITISDLPLFSHFRLINAMLGFDAPLLPVSNIYLKL